MAFKVQGKLRIGDKFRSFEREIEAKDKDAAKEKVYSLFGSEHGCQRRWINIDKIESVKKDAK